ncbi:RNA pseudouridine synthase [Treponema sp. OMZ 840]|uniref:pseudouridine synthase n=1 Tax=Treponema sp. OMZ 840 TaxID=244313 RepID=UPI003D8DF10E
MDTSAKTGSRVAENCEFKISLIFEDADFIVIDKPAGLPSAPLHPYENTAYSQITDYVPETAFVCGKKSIEGGLVHRLDTATRGLLLAARTQKAFDNFQKQQSEGRFIKYYCAYCLKTDQALELLQKQKDFPLVIKSRFRSYGVGNKKVKPVFTDAGKADLKKAGKTTYRTEIVSICDAGIKNGNAAVKVVCKIANGFRHQVRSHLAAYGLPVIGDFAYNPECSATADKPIKQELCFTACALKFNHPLTNEPLCIVLKGFEISDFI